MSDRGLIVSFKPGVGRDARNALHHQVGARLISELVSVAADVVVITSRLTVAEALTRYQADVRVRSIEFDARQRVPEKVGVDEGGS